MKIAVSVWEGKVSPVFDTASRVLILDLEEKRETSCFETYLDNHAPIRKCSRIQILGIDVLICGAISRYFQCLLTASDICVIPWVCGSAREVVEAFKEGNLFHPRFLMPGCSRKKGQKCKQEIEIQKHGKRMKH